jgi:hypothetical protein
MIRLSRSVRLWYTDPAIGTQSHREKTINKDAFLLFIFSVSLCLCGQAFVPRSLVPVQTEKNAEEKNKIELARSLFFSPTFFWRAKQSLADLVS